MSLMGGLLQGAAIAAFVLAGAARSEATTLHLADGNTSAEVCVTGCGDIGLHNWLVDGIDMSFDQYFHYLLEAEGSDGTPPPVEGWLNATDFAVTTSGSGTGPTAWFTFGNPYLSQGTLGAAGFGGRVDYAIVGASSSGPAKIVETVTLNNLNNWFEKLYFSDSAGFPDGYFRLDPQGSEWDTVSFTREFSSVPEPTSMLLLGTGLAAIGRAARRRMRSA